MLKKFRNLFGPENEGYELLFPYPRTKRRSYTTKYLVLYLIMIFTLFVFGFVVVLSPSDASSAQRHDLMLLSPEEASKSKSSGIPKNEMDHQATYEYLISNRHLPKRSREARNLGFNFSSTDFHFQRNLISATETFSYLQKRHVLAVREMIMHLDQHQSVEEFLEIALYLRDSPSMNRQAWFIALQRGKASSSNTGVRELRNPYSFPELFPELIMPGEHIQRAVIAKGQCVVTDGSVGEDNGIENRLWHFREDYFFNSHHYFWHLYITDQRNKVPTPDRAGELFFFMHHEFMARYYNERSSANLFQPPETLQFLPGSRIAQGYNAHLSLASSGVIPAPRPDNMLMSDIMLVGIQNVTMKRTNEVYNSILEGIQNGYLIQSNGSQLSISNWTGVNTLGEVVFEEVHDEIPLPGMDAYQEVEYGFHTQGHVLISFIMDPQNRSNLTPGPLQNPGTSLRDPAFYSFHRVIEDIYQAHQSKLEPYKETGSELPLSWSGVKLLEISVTSDSRTEPNELQTHWAKRKFDIRFGLDWHKNKSAPVNICAKYLTHEPFSYKIRYENTQPTQSKATVRIFLAPRFQGNNGTRFSMNDQRHLFFHLDRFTTTLYPGKQEIVRSSLDSTLTVPSRTWSEIQKNTYDEHYCGCGFPQHLLLPKGTVDGSIYDLFVMLTNGEEDTVKDATKNARGSCQSAPIWCTNYGVKYPDSKPMGYPFDRPPYQVQDGNQTRPVADLEEFMAGIENMKAIQVTIRHLDLVVE